MRGIGRLAAAVLALGVAVSVTACTQEAGASSDGAGATTVAVTLQEWTVNPDVDTAPAGEVTFEITNNGPDDEHEFVVLRTDLAPDDLPADETGTVSEAGEGMEVMGEVEDIPVDTTETLTLDLEAGSYVLLCNIYTEDEAEAHYAMGMHTAFTVE